jgi:hypothetical protein
VFPCHPTLKIRTERTCRVAEFAAAFVRRNGSLCATAVAATKQGGCGVEANTSLIGFVGAPFGIATRHARRHFGDFDAVDMATARSVLGEDVPISGNLDPTVLFGSQEQIEPAVRYWYKHLLNLGHGVMQGTPEISVKWLVDECKRYQGKIIIECGGRNSFFNFKNIMVVTY